MKPEEALHIFATTSNTQERFDALLEIVKDRGFIHQATKTPVFDSGLTVVRHALSDQVIAFERMHGESLETGKDGLTVLKDEAWQHLEERVPPIRKEIETTFRKLIGLTPSSTTPSKTG